MNKNSALYQFLGRNYNLLKTALRPITERILISKAQKLHRAEEIKLRDKKIYKVVFLALDASVWKCDPIYRRFQSNEHFEPLILVCPIVNKGRNNMLEKMEQCYNLFVSRGYNVIKSYNEKDNSYIDLRSLNPDIILYTNPYKGLIDGRYYIDNFLDKLTVYVPYYINGTNDYEMAYNQPVHNLSWKYYVESPIHKEMAQGYSYAKGRNVVVSGYPGIEDFIDNNYIPSDVWKIKDRSIKRIIWAAHQTIEFSGTVNYSTFLKYYEYMLQMADKYKNQVQFAFKPHPLLKQRLYDKWGKEKTDAYYNEWANRPNTMIADSDYHDLFLTSDAMIHDCGSFTIEYLYLNKPVMRLMNGIDPHTMFGDFGMNCINQHYLAYDEDDIIAFVENVINDTDIKGIQRRSFKENILLSSHLPSEVIINDIIESIKEQRNKL